MKRMVAVMLAALLALGLCACTAKPMDAGILTRFETTDLDGNPVNQALFADYRLTMVNIWATYCGPCLREMPDLGRLAREYAAQGVAVVGIVSDVTAEDTALAREQVAEAGADYTNVVPSADLTNLLSQVSAVPTTIFVDSRGVQVGSTYLGAKSHDQWAAVIDTMLEQQDAHD